MKKDTPAWPGIGQKEKVMKKRRAMVSMVGLSVAFVLVCGMALAKTSSRYADDGAKEKATAASSEPESPFACDRLALDPEAVVSFFQRF